MAISLMILARSRLAMWQPSIADSRYGYRGDGGHPMLSGTAAVTVAAGVAAVLVFALVAPDVQRRINDPIPTTFITHPADPVPIPPPPSHANQPATTTTLAPPRAADPAPQFVDSFPGPGPITFGPINAGLGEPGGGEVVAPPHTPVVHAPQRDPAFARAFQPPYPAAQQREGVEGTVRVRVTVAPDGHVVAVEQLSATSAAFFAAVERQALTRWRFVPATRDGVPVESTIVQTVRFTIDR